jgi:glucose/arabinose dehydrogenase
MRYLALGLGWAMAVLAQEVELVTIATGFDAPVDIQHAGDGSGRLFVVEQKGLIRIVKEGVVQERPLLDIRHKTTGEGEQGLLGLAFPRGFAESQRFYVNYTDRRGDTIIAMYRAAGDVADADSETVLLRIPQPYSNHNGGQLRFGPDGFLYIGMGDGGAGGDPENHAQRGDSLLGKMLRVDVESEPGQVRVPADNPFVGVEGTRPEIWALGLRNPWRFSFDRKNGDLWIGDVGQDTYEEISHTPAPSRGGENYGWSLMEGDHCYQPGCVAEGLVRPVAEYRHTEGCSVTGGFVYRGSRSPALDGVYLYGDFCSGRLWGLRREGDAWRSDKLRDTGFLITSFGEDEQGEVYIADGAQGGIHHIRVVSR